MNYNFHQSLDEKSHRFLNAVEPGTGISVTIEALQFYFMKGFSEVDDVMHNTFGCILGYILVKGSRLMVKSLGLRNRITIKTI